MAGRTLPLTSKKIKEFIDDEKKGAAEYAKYGLSKLSKDELNHKRFLLRKLKTQTKTTVKSGARKIKGKSRKAKQTVQKVKKLRRK